MGGRKPKPVELKKLEGNPGKRPLPDVSKLPKDEKAPKAPSYLSKAAKAEWKRVASSLWEMGLLNRLDVQSLAIYCQSYADMTAAQEVLNREGLTYEYTNKAGEKNIMTRPEHYIVQACARTIKGFCTEFGMTPSSRSRLVLPGESKGKDELEELIC